MTRVPEDGWIGTTRTLHTAQRIEYLLTAQSPEATTRNATAVSTRASSTS